MEVLDEDTVGGRSQVECMHSGSRCIGVVINSNVRKGYVGLGDLMQLFPFTLYLYVCPLCR